MIKDDVLVFDCVAHPFNFDASNVLGNAGELFRQHLYAFHNVLTPESEPKLPADEFLKEWSTAEISRMVFDESDTDMLVAMPLPLTDLFQDGLSPWQRCVELRDENPDRTVFWGTVNPLEGRNALEQMEIQVKEYGAKAFKFYNVRYDYGEPFPWRMDDPKVAFPIYEKAQELGIDLIGVHKGVPLGPQPIEATQTWDMDGAAANFPDINFVIFHVGLPFIDETCWQLVRYPNLYASIAAPINFVGRLAEAVRGVDRQTHVMVRGRQDHLQLRNFHMAPEMGPRRLLGLRDPAGPRGGLQIPATDGNGEAQDLGREPAAPLRNGCR